MEVCETMHHALLLRGIACIVPVVGALSAWAQDLGSTAAAIGISATLGTGMGTSTRALETAREARAGREMSAAEVESPQGEEGRQRGTRGEKQQERGLYIDEIDEDEGPQLSTPPPEEYVVKKGDTLWDLCARYVGDPWAWPRVWALNPSITNPHWIFPGDRVRFAPGQAHAAASQPEEKPKAKGPRLSMVRSGTQGPRMLFVRTYGFVTSEELAAAGTIMGSREEKALLSVYDQAYVEFPAGKPLRVGETYTVYKPTDTMTHPVSGAVVGSIVEILGEVRIDQITDNRVARATILEAFDSIERGNRVGLLPRQLRPVDRRQNKVQLEGYILGTMRQRQLIGGSEMVFVDRGRKHGVEEGNSFLVVRRGDGNRPMMERVGADTDDPRFPKEVVAEVVILEARDDTSVGWVLRASKEVRRGDKLEMRKGY